MVFVDQVAEVAVEVGDGRSRKIAVFGTQIRREARQVVGHDVVGKREDIRQWEPEGGRDTLERVRPWRAVLAVLQAHQRGGVDASAGGQRPDGQMLFAALLVQIFAKLSCHCFVHRDFSLIAFILPRLVMEVTICCKFRNTFWNYWLLMVRLLSVMADRRDGWITC